MALMRVLTVAEWQSKMHVFMTTSAKKIMAAGRNQKAENDSLHHTNKQERNSRRGRLMSQTSSGGNHC